MENRVVCKKKEKTDIIVQVLVFGDVETNNDNRDAVLTNPKHPCWWGMRRVNFKNNKTANNTVESIILGMVDMKFGIAYMNVDSADNV